MAPRTVLFDVDGVLINGYTANPARLVRWDATMREDMGVDPDEFKKEFIFDIFAKKVIVG